MTPFLENYGPTSQHVLLIKRKKLRSYEVKKPFLFYASIEVIVQYKIIVSTCTRSTRRTSTVMAIVVTLTQIPTCGNRQYAKQFTRKGTKSFPFKLFQSDFTKREKSSHHHPNSGKIAVLDWNWIFLIALHKL